MKAILDGQQITFNYFKTLTQGRKVNYTIKYSIRDRTVTRKIGSFSIYPEYTDGKLSNIFISKFIMGKNVKFYKIDQNNYRATHKNYVVDFEVFGDIKN